MSLCCHYAECHLTECHYAECHYAECHYAECHYAECHYAECHQTECHYAECRYRLNAILLSGSTCFAVQGFESSAREYYGGSITVPLTSCFAGLDWSVLQIKTKNFSCH